MTDPTGERRGMNKDARRRAILAELRARPTVRISHLAEEFGVSPETVRRDVDALSDEGLIDRTYGGAARALLATEPGVEVRSGLNRAARVRIADAAARLFAEEDVLMIDAGSTTTLFAQALAAIVPVERRSRQTVITNGVGVARGLATNPSIRTLVCPGEFDLAEEAMFGADAAAFLRRFRATTAVVGAGAINVEGAMDADSRASWIKRSMRERAGRLALLVDAGKFGTELLETVFPLKAVDLMVSDAAPEGDLAQALDAAGVAVRLAP